MNERTHSPDEPAWPGWGQPAPRWTPPSNRSTPPGLLAGLALVIVLVFIGGLFIGQSGLLAFPGASPTPTPAAQQPGMTPGPGTTPGAGRTPGGPLPPAPPDAPADFGLFWEAYELIRREFVGRDQLAEMELTYGAIRGLVDALGDTGHSVFLTPEQVRQERESLGGTIVGIGVLLGERDGRPVIVSVVSGGPASTAGLRSGDELLEVDGQGVERLAPEEIAPLVRGERGTTVQLRVYRPSTDEFLDFSIERDEVRFPAVSWTMVPGTQIALLRHIQFSQDSAQQLRVARDDALAQGAQGFILDLRSNPGGLVHEAVNAASLFLPAGETVYIRELADGQRIPEETNPDIASVGVPMVVLIDEGSASSAEILSGALQANGRATLIGETTFGTGTVLITYDLSDGSAVRLAIERWLTPEGELIFDRGITPDIQIALDPQARPLEPEEVGQLSAEEVGQMDDTQLRRAIEELRGQGVR
jgi:carboxyl-terminal processing protease